MGVCVSCQVVKGVGNKESKRPAAPMEHEAHTSHAPMVAVLYAAGFHEVVTVFTLLNPHPPDSLSRTRVKMTIIFCLFKFMVYSEK